MLKCCDFVTTNVPGAPVPVFIGGARVDRLYAFAPTAGAAVNVSLISHCETCCIGVVIDTTAVPDPDVLLDCLRQVSTRCSPRRSALDRVDVAGVTSRYRASWSPRHRPSARAPPARRPVRFGTVEGARAGGRLARAGRTAATSARATAATACDRSSAASGTASPTSSRCPTATRCSSASAARPRSGTRPSFGLDRARAARTS